jgi:hypothetical protein
MPDIRILAGVVAVATSAGLAGCASAPSGDRERMAALPLAAIHADAAFALTSGSRQAMPCTEEPTCGLARDGLASELAPTAPTPFAAQVQRVAGVLQQGARHLYPDLAPRIQGLAHSGFDVYVADGGKPGSASSANGKIALNAALGAVQPYDDWLAFVIAREMGRVIARHHEENSSISIATSVIMNILLPGSGLLKIAVSKIGSELAISGLTEPQAREVDAIAVKLLQVSGYRLDDVALSVAIAPAGLDDDFWSREFRRSSEWLIVGVRGSKLTNASGMTAAGRNW